VAHLHYVLVGGMVFPLFAAFYHWAPYCSRNALSERLGRWVFGLMFVGFNVAFFPMHLSGLLGMPRRVYTYPAALGLDWLNLISTIGAFMVAAGVAVFIVDLVRHFRMASDQNAGNVWNAGTLEWLPSGSYSNRSIPIVESREPLWDDPALARNVEDGHYYLPDAPTGGRETLVTHPLTAEPQWLMRMPTPGWAHFIGALFTAGFFLLLTVKATLPALLCAVIAVAALLHWAWVLDPKPLPQPLHIGGGIHVPAYMCGPQSQSWWAMVVLMLVAGTMYGCAAFSYLYLWTSASRWWPAADAVPGLALPALAVVVLLASSVAVEWAGRCLQRGRSPVPGLVGAMAFFGLGFALEIATQRQLSPSASSYGAAVYLLLSMQGFIGVVAAVLAAYAVARSLAGLLDRERRVNFDNARLFWHYAVGQSLVGSLLLHGFVRWVA
ncbi:MAG: cbb3-type cytochrome c oxidase subunit I, partial [Burkholderiaceae bacterium]